MFACAKNQNPENTEQKSEKNCWACSFVICNSELLNAFIASTTVVVEGHRKKLGSHVLMAKDQGGYMLTVLFIHKSFLAVYYPPSWFCSDLSKLPTEGNNSSEKFRNSYLLQHV